jgi:protoporphyrinogen oxidase
VGDGSTTAAGSAPSEAPERPVVYVLGAGLAGLSCAWRLASDGARVVVLEREDVVGGCARSFHWKDMVHDCGPHRWHSRNPALIAHLEGLMGDNLTTLDRLSRIFLYKRYFNYPLETGNVVRNLPPWVLVRAFLDYFAIRLRNRIRPIPDDNFENWTRKRFGNTVYRLFFGTYTEKAWGMSASQISADWASQRISLPSLWEATKKTLLHRYEGEPTPEEVKSFWYPKRGGIGEIAERYQAEIERMGGRVLTGVDVQRVQRRDDVVTAVIYAHEGAVHTGELDQLVSTIPCTDLVRAFDPAPDPAVVQANESLRYKAIKFVFLEIERDSITQDHWVYIPDKELRTHRLSEAKNFNPRNAPAGKTVLCCEVTCFKDDEIWNMGREAATQVVVDDLQALGLVSPSEVLDSHVYNLEHAYPLYTLEYRPHIESVLAFVDSFANLTSTGRQGRFKYNNMDHSMEMGLAAGEELARGQSAVDHVKVATGTGYFG